MHELLHIAQVEQADGLDLEKSHKRQRALVVRHEEPAVVVEAAAFDPSSVRTTE